MPRARTEQFGELEYSEESKLEFPRGLPGFEECRQFVLMEEDRLAPLVHLQSLEIADLCFLALPVRVIDMDYETEVTAEERTLLGLPREAELGRGTLDLALLSAGVDGGLTANLLAPVVVNLANRVAVQAVRLDHRYSHQHPLGELGGEEAPPC
jgi:flagellar assembly factor FliW